MYLQNTSNMSVNTLLFPSHCNNINHSVKFGDRFSEATMLHFSFLSARAWLTTLWFLGWMGSFGTWTDLSSRTALLRSCALTMRMLRLWVLTTYLIKNKIPPQSEVLKRFKPQRPNNIPALIWLNCFYFFKEVIFPPHVLGILAFKCSHSWGGNGALLWRLFVLWTPHWEWFLLWHVPGWTEVSNFFLLCSGQLFLSMWIFLKYHTFQTWFLVKNKTKKKVYIYQC